MAQTIAYAKCAGLVVLAHGEQPPSDPEWQLYLQQLDHSAGAVFGVLVVTDGAGPNGKQRSALNDLVAKHGGSFRTAVVTQSVAVRGLVTALSWFNSGIRAYPPEALGQALDYLEVRPSDAGAVRACALSLRVGLVTTAFGPAGEPLGSTVARVEELLAKPLARLREEIARTGRRPSSPR